MTRRNDLVALRDAIALIYAYSTDMSVNSEHFRGWAEVELRISLDGIEALIAQEPDPAPMTPVIQRGMHE